MDIGFLWNNGTSTDWIQAEKCYDAQLKSSQLAIEAEMDCLNPDDVYRMNVEEFYDFLYHKYFVWKYDPRRLATSRNRKDTKSLSAYKRENSFDSLGEIHRELFSFDLVDIQKGLSITQRIYGLGIAGASGLLAVLFPNYYGTVDKYVVTELQKIDGYPWCDEIHKMNPDCSISISSGETLIRIMREKALELNNKFDASYWTPRKIDKVLWGMRSNDI